MRSAWRRLSNLHRELRDLGGLLSGSCQWSASYTMILAGIRASFALFDGAWKAVMRSPTGWHDRTPVSRSVDCELGRC